MMKKRRRLIGCLLAVFMLIGMLSLTVAVTAPKAQAASAGSYNLRITYDVGDQNNGGSTTLTVWYKPNNGTGTETSTSFSVDDINNNTGSNRTSTFTVGGFPTKMKLTLSQGGMRTQNATIKKGEIGNTSNQNWKTGWTGSVKVDPGWWGTKDSGELSLGSAPTPSCTGKTVSGSDAITMKKNGGGNTTSSYSVTIGDLKDQYGVQWPSPVWSENSDYCSISNTSSAADSATLTVSATSATIAKQTVTVSAISNGKTVGSKTVTLYPTFKYGFNASTNGGTLAAAVADGTVVNDTGNAYKAWTVASGYTASKSNALGDWEFVGWNGDSAKTTGVKPGGSINIDNYNDTLYAIFSKTLRYKFNFLDANGNAVTGDSTTPTAVLYNNETSGSVTTPSHSGTTKVGGIDFSFKGWTAGTSATAATTNNTGYTISASSDGYVTTDATETTPNMTANAVYQKTATANFTYYLANGTKKTESDTDTILYNVAGNYNRTKAAISFPNAGDVTVDGKTYSFIGWTKTAGGFTVNETTVNADKSLDLQNGDYNYYAVYETDVGLTYDLNGGSVASGISGNTVSQKVVAGAATIGAASRNDVQITVNPGGVTPTRTGAEVNAITPDAGFRGWMVKSASLDPQYEPAVGETGLYANGSTITIGKDVTLLAMYKDSRFLLKTKNYDGESAVYAANGAVIGDQQIRYQFDGSVPAMDAEGVDHYDDAAHYVFIGFQVEQGNTLLGDAEHGYTVKTITADTKLIAQFRSYPHTWKIDSVIQEATCGQAGIVNRHCTVCGLTQNNYSTDKLGHQTQLFDVKAATCTTDGTQGREVCMVCYKVKCYACEANGVEDPFVTLATETVNGVKKKVCPVCGGVYDEVINPAVPAYGQFNEQGKRVHVFDYEGAYTLDAAGNKVYKCLYCDRTVTVYASSGLVRIPEVPATCTAEGCQAYYTDNEGHYYTDSSGYNDVTLEELVIPTLSATGEHVWEDVAAASPTCTEPGYVEGTQICTVCGTYSEAILPAAHIMSDLFAAAEPTCTAPGNVAYYYCSRCDQYYEDANGVKRISNSFTKDRKAYCAECDAIVSVTKDAEDNWFCAVNEGHTDLTNTYVFLNKIAHTAPEGTAAQTIIPSCLQQGGRYFGVCTVCGQEIWTNVTDALGHNLQWVNGVDATCTSTGKEGYYKCVNGCGAWYRDIRVGEAEDDIEALPNAVEGKKIITEQAIVEKLPHTLTAEEEVEATCTSTGNVAYWICDVCGKYFADEDGETEIEDRTSVVVGKKEHDFSGEPIETYAGDCKHYSYAIYKCANCDETKRVNGDKGDHNYVIEQQAATCGADGFTREKCTLCGKTRNETTINATGNHTPGEWVVDGNVRRTNCTVCGQELTEIIEQPTEPDQPATPSGERCPKCGFVHEGRTGIYVEDGLYCRVVGFFRKIFTFFK